MFFQDDWTSPFNIIQPPQAKEKNLQAIYEYLTKYFAPKPRQRGSCSQADSSESQDHNADLDDADSGPGVAGGEGDGMQTECDPYDAVDPPNSENQALVESQAGAIVLVPWGWGEKDPDS